MVGGFLQVIVLLVGLGLPCVALGEGTVDPLIDSLTMAIRSLPVWAEWWAMERGDGPLPAFLPADGVITSHFGGRRHPLWHEWRAHHGVDIAGSAALPTQVPRALRAADPSPALIRATQMGVVHAVGWRGGYGLAVEVDHGHGWHSVYAHLARVDVRRGEIVRAGARIGAMGSTGWATGPHLHFELRYFNTPIDPVPYLLQLARH